MWHDSSRSAAAWLALVSSRGWRGGSCRGRPALIALVLFAFSDDLNYYSSELKPYSMDLACGLAITLMSIRRSWPQGEPVPRRALAILSLARALVSFASAFVVAGCGLTLVVSSLCWDEASAILRSGC